MHHLIKSFVDILNSQFTPINENDHFYTKEGKKYIKIIRNGAVHAFIDSDLNVYKPASWNSPAKGIRYNLEKDWEVLKKNADIYGSYLYRRG